MYQADPRAKLVAELSHLFEWRTGHIFRTDCTTTLNVKLFPLQKASRFYQRVRQNSHWQGIEIILSIFWTLFNKMEGSLFRIYIPIRPTWMMSYWAISFSGTGPSASRGRSVMFSGNISGDGKWLTEMSKPSSLVSGGMSRATSASHVLFLLVLYISGGCLARVEEKTYPPPHAMSATHSPFCWWRIAGCSTKEVSLQYSQCWTYSLLKHQIK